MVAVGCDIEEIKRFKDIVKNREFLANVFTDREVKYCLEKKNAEAYFARHFVCKEAVFKALSSFGKPVPLKFIEILTKGENRRKVRILHKRIGKSCRIFVDAMIAGKIAMASSIAQIRK